jgi:hypothetical protein
MDVWYCTTEDVMIADRHFYETCIRGRQQDKTRQDKTVTLPYRYHYSYP